MVSSNDRGVGQTRGSRRQGEGKDVPRLVSLTLTKVLRLLTEAVRQRTWQVNKAALTHIVHTHIPHNIRQDLQERVLHDWRVYDTVSLRLLELLFSSTTSTLRLVHVRTFYRDSFIDLLLRLTGLQKLNIQDPVWRLSRRQLRLTADALSRMVQLRVLTLHYCGHDLLLAVTGTHCPNLQEVDVRWSQSVSDEGVWGLVTAPTARHDSLTSTSSHKMTFNLRSCWGAAFRSLASKMRALNDPPSPQISDAEPLKEETLSWSACCSTLVYVDLRCTSVTQVGVGLLARALPAHTRLAHDAHTLSPS